MRATGPAITALLALLAAVAAPASAAPAKGPCIPGQKAPKCHLWTGKVGAVDDGDTITANLEGDRAGWLKLRLTGIQAMELTRYGRKRGRVGECNGVAAAERLEQLIRRGGSRIRVAAHDPSSSTGERNRLRRSIAVRHGKRWVDPAAVLVEEGLALWFPNPVEWAWNRQYSRAAETAALRGLGLWNPNACGAGVPLGRLRMKVKWDADGVDSSNVNGEWVRITNTDPVEPVPIGGWWFRDSHLRRYTFPPGAQVPAGGSVKLHVGQARASGADKEDDEGGGGLGGETVFHWGLRETVFENVTDDAKQIGDGGYLFDPKGNLRAWMQYPCRVACNDPLAGGAVELDASPRAPEYVTVTNRSAGPLDLGEAEIESRPWFYEIEPGTVLAPGQTFTLWIRQGAGRQTPYDRDWGRDSYLLGDRKDVVTLRNRFGAPVACDAWGGERCPDV